MPPDGRTERPGRGPSISGALAALVTLLIAWRAAAEEKPFGLAKRPVWTNSRLVGSPEPSLQSSAAIRIAKTDVAARQRLPLSNMPTGIVNVLKREEVLDLLAYLLADGATGEGPSGK